CGVARGARRAGAGVGLGEVHRAGVAQGRVVELVQGGHGDVERRARGGAGRGADAQVRRRGREGDVDGGGRVRHEHLEVVGVVDDVDGGERPRAAAVLHDGDGRAGGGREAGHVERQRGGAAQGQGAGQGELVGADARQARPGQLDGQGAAAAEVRRGAGQGGQAADRG